MQDLFKKAGAPYDPSMIGVTRHELRDMFPFVQLMRWRFNVLDLAKRCDPSMIGVTRHELRDMFPFVQLMRWRFNVLDLAKRCMVYDDLVDSVFAPGGAWDLNEEIPVK